MNPTTRLKSFLFKDRSPLVLILISLIIGVLYIQVLFGYNYFSTNSSYWDYPVGLIGGQSDQPSIFSYNRYYVHDQWSWPPFFTNKINWPFGVNIAHVDAIPVFSLIGKLAFTLYKYNIYKYNINLFAFWCAAMFPLNGVAMTVLLFTLGHRTLFSALIGTCFALLMPALIWRFGHAALTAHFTILLNLALYIFYKKNPRYFKRIFILFLINTVLSLMVTPYLFLMNLVIFSAFFLQCLFDKSASYKDSIKGGLLFISITLTVMYLEQLVGKQGVGKSWGFGFYSMNLLSPFWPQSSGLLSWTGNYWLNRGSIGGTAGQYEGFNYLGIGGIGLMVIAFSRRWRQLPGLIKQHATLVLAMLLLTLFALSNKIYLG
jgi:hypothetical protein